MNNSLIASEKQIYYYPCENADKEQTAIAHVK